MQRSEKSGIGAVDIRAIFGGVAAWPEEQWRGIQLEMPRLSAWMSPVEEGQDVFRRAVTAQEVGHELKVGGRLFEYAFRDAFLHVLRYLPREDFEKLRKLSVGVRDAFEDYQKSDPIGKFWGRSIVKFGSYNWMEANEKDKRQFELCFRHELKCSLLLLDNPSRNAFLNLLTTLKVDGGSCSMVVQKIKLLRLLDLGALIEKEDQDICKKILSIISLYPRLFLNLKFLDVGKLSNLTGVVMPRSVKSFNFRMMSNDVNICNQNFKSIMLSCVPAGASFVMRNLPKLEFLKIETMNCSATLDLREMPSLKDININRKPVLFDRSVDVVIAIGVNQPIQGRGVPYNNLNLGVRYVL